MKESIEESNQRSNSKRGKLWTIRLLFIGVVMNAFTFLIASKFGPTVLAFFWFFCFSLGLLGMILGLRELKENRLALMGVIGNLALLVIFIALLLSSLRSPEIVP